MSAYQDKAWTFPLKTKWLWFYMYIRVPLSILLNTVNLISYCYAPSWDPVDDTTVWGTAVSLIFYVVFFLCLLKLNTASFVLLWVTLIGESLVLVSAFIPLYSEELGIYYLIYTLCFLAVWTLPNAIYFFKRRLLFSNRPYDRVPVPFIKVSPVNGHWQCPCCGREGNVERHPCTNCRALPTFRCVDAAPIKPPVSEPVRNVPSPQAESPAKPPITEPQAVSSYVCRQCGTALPLDSVFCHECGTKVLPPSAFCSKCGEKLGPDDKFCRMCGGKVE